MEERCGASSTDARLLERLPQLRLGEPVLVDVDDLVLDAGMRYNGEDPSHSRVLAAIGDVLPPIFVHQPSMIVLDGVHRVRATRRMGHARILARLVSGSLADAFVLGVRANTAHGKPLTLAERERCARKVLTSHPDWSDRVIADTCGLSGTTVGLLRRRSTDQNLQTNSRRIGRDGKWRPIDASESRRKAAELIRELPQASLREIARRSQLSPATVKDVRDRLERGDPPVSHSSDRSYGSEGATPQHPPTRLVEDAVLTSVAGFAEWFAEHAICDDDWTPYVAAIPISRVYDVADRARAYAVQWRRFADALEARSRRRAG